MEVLKELTQDEINRLFELYQEECKQSKVFSNLKDFILWCEERF